jgi:trehalose 6-phosphate phosphatase
VIASPTEWIAERIAEAALLLDFDGTLAPIVARPEDARPAPGATDVLRSLAGRARLVAVVTGRPSATVRNLLGDVPGLRIVGLYGFEDAPALAETTLEEIRSVAAGHVGVELEPKGPSVAVHFRNAPDPEAAGPPLRAALEGVARERGLHVLAGKKVWELAPIGAGGKGDAVTALLAEVTPTAAMYAGDDLADLDGFAALDRYADASSVLVRKVAVLGDETPVLLREAADVLVEGPPGLVEMLRGL